jgi:Cys-rich four helix bundle protein (predicted Tat secretion target)
MNRRQLLVGTGGLVLGAIVGGETSAGAADPHAAHGAGSTLADAAAECIAKGEACLQHCIELLASGDATLKDCARAVVDMLAVNGALMKLAATHSTHTAAQAKLAVAVNERCEAECRKHAEKHAPCKACAEACAKTIAAATAASA